MDNKERAQQIEKSSKSMQVGPQNKQNFPKLQEIYCVMKRIKNYIHKTPILSSHYLSSLTQCQLYFKCENFQKTGSFKVRGAANKILQMSQPKTICAFSGGNHAQGVAYIAKSLGIQAKIIMPSTTPQVKKNAVRNYGATIIQSEPQIWKAEKLCKQVAYESKSQIVHPFNDFQVIAGCATVGLQIYEDLQDIDYIVLPIGGGGLSSGVSLVTHYLSPKTQVIGVQPQDACDAYLSLKQGALVTQYFPKTKAQGLTPVIGLKNFSILQKYLSDVILVTQIQMVNACQIIAQRMKIVVERSGAAALAAIMKDKRFVGKKVCVILTGGNIDFSTYFDNLRSNIKQ